jgi:GNAT superfamily N-acetyltransferase
MEEVIVRLFESRDQEKVTALYRSGQDQYLSIPVAGQCYQWFVMDKLKEDGDTANVEKYFMANPANSGFWVAEVNGDIVGFVGATPSSRFGDEYTELVRMFVQPNLRQKSVGKKLVAALEEWAVKAGYRHIYLSTLSALPLPNAFYPKCGFVLAEHEEFDVTERLSADTFTTVGVNHYVKAIV